MGFGAVSGETVPFLAVLCHFRNPSGAEQLQQVADRAHQTPLAANILFATQAEAAKTALFLDLSEDRFDNRLAHFVHGASIRGSQLVAHRLFRRGVRRRRIADGLRRVAMLVAARRHVQLNVLYGLIGYIRLAEVARVGADLLRRLFQIRPDLRDHGQQLHFVVRLLRNLGGHDYLRRGIDRDLCVVALHEAALVGAVRHDPALRIGEVALRRVVWLGLVGIGCFWFAATLFLACAPLFFFAFGQLLLGLGALLRGLFLGFLFQSRFGLADLLQPTLTPL